MNELEERLRRYADAVTGDDTAVSAEEACQRAGHRSRPLATWLAVAAVLAVLIGVGATLLTENGDDTEAVVTGNEFPLTLDGHRDWQLALVNGDVGATEDEVRGRYSDEFLAAVPPSQVLRTREAVASLGPWGVLREIERRDDVLAVQLRGRDDEQARLTLMVGDDGKLVASTILRAEPCADAVPADTELAAPLAAQLDWVKHLLASTSQPSETELRDHFAPTFLSAVPVDQFIAALGQVRALGPYTYRHHEGAPLSSSLTMRVGLRTGEEARLTLAVEPQPPHRITGFAVKTQQPCRL